MAPKVDLLATIICCGLAVVSVGWVVGSWWICCSQDALQSHHHVAFHATVKRRPPVESGLPPPEPLRQPPPLPGLDVPPGPPRPLLPPPLLRGGGEEPVQPHAPLTGADVPAADAARPEMRGSIFILIAAYREHRGAKTLASAFDTAAHPEKVWVGVFQQRDESTEPDALDLSEFCGEDVRQEHAVCRHRRQIASRSIDWRESEGPCVARANAEALLGDQEFVLQVDAHTTFAKDWDARLLAMWQSTNDEFAVLSGYPRSEGQLRGDGSHPDFRNMPMICTAKMLDWSVRHMLKNTPGDMPLQNHPVRTPYFGAGLVFSKAHRVRQVPYDPHLHYLFDGEEFDMAMRLFTHGYDIYAPSDTVLYHFYSSPQLNKKLHIAKFWDYQWGRRFPIMFRSTRRLRHKIGLPSVLEQDHEIDNADLEELDRYGNGQRRTVQQFLDYAGIDYPNKRVPGACDRVRRPAGLDHVPWIDGEAEERERHRWSGATPAGTGPML